MKSYKKKILAALFTALFFWSPVVSAQTESENKNENEAEPISITVEWKPVIDTERYRLEIQTIDGKTVVSQETKDTSLTLMLKPGQYQRRIGLINKFNKLSLWSAWSPLNVVKILTPRLTPKETPRPIKRGGQRQLLPVEIEGEMEQTKYYILHKDGTKTPIQLIHKDDATFINLDPNTLPMGEYDLVMENPLGEIDVKKSLIQIEPSKKEQALMRKPINLSFLVPGLPQAQRNEKTKSQLIAWSFFGSAAIAVYSYNQAIVTSRQMHSNPFYQMYENTLPFAITGISQNNPQFTTYAVMGFSQGQKKAALYQKQRDTYYAASALSVILYSYHLYDVYRFDIKTAQSPAGAELKLGLSWNF